MHFLKTALGIQRLIFHEIHEYFDEKEYLKDIVDNYETVQFRLLIFTLSVI